MYAYRSEMDLEGPILGCNRLQIYGMFALSCRDLQNYLVDVATSSENGASGLCVVLRRELKAIRTARHSNG